MNDDRAAIDLPEPERYELHEGAAYHFPLDRREFVSLLGAGLLVTLAEKNASAQRQGGGPRTIGQRLHLGENGVITVMTSKVEVGQGARTQITQAAAEELRVGVDNVLLIMADTSMGPDDGGTAGSRTTPATVPAVRRACAAMREVLIDRAARVLGEDHSKLSVREGKVVGSGSQEFTYADLARQKDLQEDLDREVSAGITITPVSEWKVLGTPVPRAAGVSIVTGAHRYPSDISRTGMLHGRMLRPPQSGATLVSIDLEPAKAVEGVVAVRDGSFVGFAAPSSFAADQALVAAGKTAVWNAPPHSASSKKLTEYLRAHVSSSGGRGRSGPTPKGSVKDGLASADRVLRQSYDIAYIQHAPMEPRAAVAEWSDGRLTVWTGTQQPGRVRGELSQTFRIPLENVRVIVPDTGGGFGGKHSGEVAVEAARLAFAAKRPVSVRWTREEEFTWAYFRPGGVIDIAAGLDKDHGLIAWEQINYNSGGSAVDTPYDIPNTHGGFRSCDPPLRGGSYRALASTANVFARESFMDELAAAAGADPLAFRLRHLPESRLRAVLTAAAERFDWAARAKKASSTKDIGVGLSCGTEKASFTAACVELAIDRARKRFRVAYVCQAFECGAIQNPQNLRKQVEGCIIQGLGGALRESMQFEDGKILNPSFAGYLIPRFRDVPKIETILLNRPDITSVGAGETPIIAIAPAIANALDRATGVRIRSLPIRNSEWQCE